MKSSPLTVIHVASNVHLKDVLKKGDIKARACVCVLGVQQLDTRDERVSCELMSERTLGTQSPVPLLLRCVLMHARAFFLTFHSSNFSYPPLFSSINQVCSLV